MMHAYDQTLRTKARTTMAWMFDYAVYIQELDLADFYHLFLDPSISKKFESGDSSTIAGKSGAELAYHVLKENGMEVSLKQPVFTMYRTQEYWLGWSLSYYQWVKNFSFKQITDVTDIDELLLMYKKYHEMDIEHFVIELDIRRKNVFSESALKRFRAYAMSLNDMRYIRSATTKPLDVHLMIEHPNTNIGLFLQNLHKGDTVYIHPEAEYQPSTTLQKIIDAGMVPGIAINPGTSIETVMEMLVIVDKVLVMSVNPGNAGQMYLPYVGKKIDKMLRLKEELGFKVYWDGACSADKIITYAPKGVDGFVFGNHTDIYNPWSILCYAREQLFKCYWIDTGGYELLSRLIVEGDNSLKIDLEALLRGDAESMEDFINDVALDMVSFFDVGRKTPKTEPERFYHGLVLGLIVELKDCYYIISNRESGRGRYDIMLKPLQDELPAILIEFKVYNEKKEKTLEDTARQALAQIEERDYARMFMNEGINAGRIKKYGFAFNGKAVMILESEL